MEIDSLLKRYLSHVAFRNLENKKSQQALITSIFALNKEQKEYVLYKVMTLLREKYTPDIEGIYDLVTLPNCQIEQMYREGDTEPILFTEDTCPVLGFDDDTIPNNPFGIC